MYGDVLKRSRGNANQKDRHTYSAHKLLLTPLNIHASYPYKLSSKLYTSQILTRPRTAKKNAIALNIAHKQILRTKDYYSQIAYHLHIQFVLKIFMCV